jgi:hypothetical protein
VKRQFRYYGCDLPDEGIKSEDWMDIPSTDDLATDDELWKAFMERWPDTYREIEE